MRRPVAVSLIAVLLGTGLAVRAEKAPDPLPDKPALMPREQEIERALEAAPAHLRAGASVWVLAESGYVEARKGDNGFTCIVVRDHPLNQKPTCWDAEGTRTIVPRVLFEGELLMKGTALGEIATQVRAGFESGRFEPPARVGIAYMLSPNIRRYIPATGEIGTFPPHLMFYAPNLTNADIGTTPEAIRGGDPVPFVGYQGPHGYIIVVPNRPG